MDEETPWDKQRRLKYEHHDFAISDFKKFDLDGIKAGAQRDLIQTARCDAAECIIDSFMAYLKNNGYRITKVNK